MVVLVLVVVWVAVLTPRLVRHFREGRSHSSIESFHEQLHLLERTGPKLVEPAYRLEVPATGPSTPGLALVESNGPTSMTPRLAHALRQKQTLSQSRRRRRRRRDLLLGLLAVAACTGGLGEMHALHLLWAITGVSALAIAGYVALVAYAQMLHADRDAVRPITVRAPEAADPAWGTARPLHASRTTSPAVEIVGTGSPRAARAGYPGAWDDDVLVSVLPRHAAGGG